MVRDITDITIFGKEIITTRKKRLFPWRIMIGCFRVQLSEKTDYMRKHKISTLRDAS